jgi:hypothetical protein
VFLCEVTLERVGKLAQRLAGWRELLSDRIGLTHT